MPTNLFTFKPLTEAHLTFFNKYKELVDSKVREKYPSIPDDFELQPVLGCILAMAGIHRRYKIALPENQLLEVLIFQGDIIPQGATAPELVIHVVDKLTSASDA